ncbi:unnamed protein product [Sphagnum compactum]
MEDRPSFGNAGAGDGSVHKRCMKAMEDPVSKEYYLVPSLYLREWSRSADETSSFYFGVDASSTMRAAGGACLKNGGIRFTIIGNKYYFEPSSSAAHHLQQRLKAKLGDVRSAMDDVFIQLAISRTVIFLSQQSGEALCFS